MEGGGGGEEEGTVGQGDQGEEAACQADQATHQGGTQ